MNPLSMASLFNVQDVTFLGRTRSKAAANPQSMASLFNVQDVKFLGRTRSKAAEVATGEAEGAAAGKVACA